jgi:hypothetical protein
LPDEQLKGDCPKPMGTNADHRDLICRSAQGNLNLQRLEPGSLFAGSCLSFEFFLKPFT